MSGDIDVRSVIAAADRAADIAERGWRDYAGHGPGRFAGLTTAVTVGRSIPSLLRTLEPVTPGWDEWWNAHADLHDTADRAWLRRLHAEMEDPGVPAVAPEDPDPSLARELMRHAPRDTVTWFTGDDLGRTGWKVQLPDGSIENVYFTIPPIVTRVYAALLDAAGGRTIGSAFPAYLSAMRMLIAAAHERFEAYAARGT